ncbi:MAG: heme exporter protein CcmD [Chiayiivirga sp.]|jgi:heme exporter protein CcmD|uniref:heme exporter protein CcmD n=1 Tax=Chiayiivirga sp. TaxID=2041042 RepID=UPI0025B829D9|nr:heme exporter protein CcmD [Chiayiivirga sp.]MCI1709620.1 heme exporter protein CcmD [Chiayiivirga sp.]MCI1730094.1 heme exporter protein CcmD [Chiayiivirga sp.]
MNELIDMGKYDFYVWTSYALFGAMLVWDLALPRWRERRTLRSLAQRIRRERARQRTKTETAA